MHDKRILFEVTHPKHFHQFKNLAALLNDENEILFLARNKDVLLALVKDTDFNFERFDFFGKSLTGKALIIPKILARYSKVIRAFQPDYLLSRSSPYSTSLSRFFKFKTIIFPDSEVVKLTRRYVAPLANLIITPGNYTIDYGNKHHRLHGLFEETYLSPKFFNPNKKILHDLGINSGEKYYVVRFVGWKANHDVGQYGFNYDQKKELINKLSQKGKVFISSENPLEEEFEQFRINVHPREIHNILYYADLYVGDSQSMATEAALLGTPSLRFNSFVGENDMSNFQLLENRHGLLHNFKNPEQLIEKALEIINNSGAKSEWQIKRNSYFSNSIDLNSQTLDIIQEYINKS